MLCRTLFYKNLLTILFFSSIIWQENTWRPDIPWWLCKGTEQNRRVCWTSPKIITVCASVSDRETAQVGWLCCQIASVLKWMYNRYTVFPFWSATSDKKWLQKSPVVSLLLVVRCLSINKEGLIEWMFFVCTCMYNSEPCYKGVHLTKFLSYTFSWIQEFGEEGLQCLIKHLRDSCSKRGNIDKRIQHECVRCLKAFMNNKVMPTCLENFLSSRNLLLL